MRIIRDPKVAFVPRNTFRVGETVWLTMSDGTSRDELQIGSQNSYSRSSQSGINIRIIDFGGINTSKAPSKSPTKDLQVFLRVSF